MVLFIAALREEFDELASHIETTEEVTLSGIRTVLGSLYGRRCALAECSMGKVSAARAASLLIERLKPACVINAGSAGALSPALSYGELIIARDCFELDFDISAIGGPLGISGPGRLFPCDEGLVAAAEKAALALSIKYTVGRTATADKFENSPEIKLMRHEKFACDCDDMESAAIAMCCGCAKVPFLSIRSVSDKPRREDEVDFWGYLNLASKSAAAAAALTVKYL